MSIPNPALVPLISKIQEIQHTITLDQAVTGAKEARTRPDLIDPLLRALGWDNSSVITREYHVGSKPEHGTVDYALHPSERGSPILFLEAKSLKRALTKGHYDQVLKYARHRMRSVRQFALTNGDQWVLYEFVKGEPRRVFKLSIRDQSASECANLLLTHFPKPPGFETAGSANRPEVAITVASESNALSRAPETNVIPSSGWTSGVDVPKALTWFAVSLISFGILGWTIGLSIAQPIENLFAAIGIVAVLGMLIVAVIVFRRFFPSAVPKAIKALRRQLFAPINGDRRKTRTWVAGTTFCGSGLGFLFGYPLGNSMADFITESLSIFGILFILVIIIIGPISISRKKKKSQ